MQNQDKTLNNKPSEGKAIPSEPNVALGFVLGLLFSIVAVNLWVWFYLNPFVKTELIRSVTQSTDSLYILDIDRLGIRPLRSSIDIKGLTLRKNPDKWQSRLDTSKRSQLALDFTLNRIQLQQIRWWDLIQKRQLFIGSILIKKPALSFSNYRLEENAPKPPPLDEARISRGIARIVSSIANEVNIGELRLQQAVLSIEGQAAQSSGAIHHTEGLDLYLEGVLLRGKAQPYLADQVRVGRLNLHVQDYQFFSADRVYQLNVHKLNLSSLDSLIAVEDISIKPLSELERNRRQNIEKYNAQRLEAHLQKITARGIDFTRLMYRRELDLRSLTLAELTLDWEINRQLQSQPQAQRTAYTQRKAKKILRQLPFYIQMDTFQLFNGRFNYHERRHKQGKDRMYHRADSVELLFKNLALGKAIKAEHQDKPLYSESVSLSLKNYEHHTPDGVYEVRFKSATLSSRDSVIRVKSARVKPLISPEAFAQRKPYQSLLFEVLTDSLYADQIDIERLAYRQQFVMYSAHLFQPKFKVFLDSRKPKNPQQQYQNFEQVLKSIPLYLKMRRFAIHNAALQYDERGLANGGEALARHSADHINLKIERIALGKASNELILENIDTKSLEITLDNYRYQSANEVYNLDFQRLRVSSARSFIEIDSLHLQPLVNWENYFDEQIYRSTLANISVPRLRGDQIDFKRLLLYQEFDWAALELQSPSVDIFTDKRMPRRPKILDSLEQAVQGLSLAVHRLLDEQVNIPENEGFNPFIYTTIAPEFSEANLPQPPTLREILCSIPVFIKIDTFRVSNASVKYRERSEADSSASGIASHHAEDINFVVPQITLGKATRYDADSTRSIFYSENLLFTLRNYEFKDKNDRYIFSLRDIKSSLADSLLLIEQLRFRPQLSRSDFIAAKPHQSMFVNVDLQSISANKIDMERLVFEQEFVISSLYINEPKLELYTDKSKPRKPSFRPKTPEELLQAIPFYISIDTFALRNATLEYIENTPLGDSLAEARHRAERINLFSRKIELALDKSSQKREAPDNLLYTEEIFLDLENYSFLPASREYQIGFKALTSSLTDSTINLESFYWQPLQSREQFIASLDYQQAQVAAKVNNINFRQIDFRKLLAGEAYVFERLAFREITLDVYHHKLLPKAPNLARKSLEELIVNLKHTVAIDTLSFEHLQLRYQEHVNHRGLAQIREHLADSLSLILYDLRLDSLANISEDRLFFAEDIKLRLENYRSRSLDSLYQISLSELKASTRAQSVEAEALWVRPTLPDSLFFAKKQYQTDRLDTKVEALTFQRLDFRKLINEQSLNLEHLQIDNLRLQVFRDKRFEKNPEFTPKMLHKVFQAIEQPLRIDTIALQNAEVEYLERVPKGVGTGKVFFTRLEGLAYQINNRAGAAHKSRIEAAAYLMGEGHITANVEIPLNAPQLYCHYYGTLGAMKASFFNYMIENNVHIRIKKGQITRVNYDVILKDTVATGVVMAGYRKLKIQVLKEDNHEKKRGLITFFGNLILRNRNNLERRRHRAGEVNYIRKPDDGFLKILWRSLATGLVDTLK